MYLNADKGNKEHRTKCVCKAIHLYHLFFYGFKRARKQCSIWYPSDGGYFPASCFSLRYGNFFCNKKNRTSIKVPRPDGSVINMEEKGSTVVSREIRKMAHQSPQRWKAQPRWWFCTEIKAGMESIWEGREKIGLSTVISTPQMLFWKLFGELLWSRALGEQ